MANSWTYSSDY